MSTTHWTWESVDPHSGQKLGKNNVINNYCIAVPSNEPRCTSCHIGLGYSNKDFDFSDPTKVDCLVCHDTTGTYKKFPTGAGHPVYDTPKEFPAGSGNLWYPPDLTDVARHAGKTSRATCGACHFFGGGGDAVKHGDLDSSLTNPTRQVDVHMGVDGGNFQCSECHATEHHQIPGTRYPTMTTDNATCESCHTATPHESSRLNSHTGRVACQTCHIPIYARGGKATKMTWDWTTAGQKDANGKNFVVKNALGHTIYDTQKGSFTWEENVIPEYVWFNGQVTYVTLDDKLDPNEVVAINRLHGDVSDPNARLIPVKRFTGRQPYDAGNRTLAVPHLFGSDPEAYWKSFDWNRALAAGMAYLDRPFSGEVGYIDTEMSWVQNHMVAPKDEALSCGDCHTPRGRLDFAALGYEPDQALALQNLARFEIAALELTPAGDSLKLHWQGEPGSTDRVQWSPDLESWEETTSGEIDPGEVAGPMEWQESSSSDTRFYRILRTWK